MLVACVVLAAAGPPATLQYVGPSSGTGKLDAYQLTTYQPNDVVFVVSDEVNVRAEPNAKAAVVGKLAMGTRVTVVAAGGGLTQVDQRVDKWYSIKGTTVAGQAVQGFLFGGALTPLGFEADLDDDGATEVATVAFTWDFKIRVRVLEPTLQGEARVTSTVLTPAGEGFLGRRGGGVSATLVASKDAGLPLVRLESRPEACSDDWIAFVSHLHAPTRTAVALQASGLVDPPNHSQVQVTFDPATKRATVVRTNRNDDDAKAPPEVTRRTLSLVGGVFVADDEQALLTVHEWPRMRADVLGCSLEKTLDHHDKRFNCALKGYKNKGDPCRNFKAWYEGPVFPADKAQRIHPLVDAVTLSWEHGELQDVTLALAGAPSEALLRRLFHLDPQPKNIQSVSVQDCGKGVRCLSLTGFDHMGAGDVDCGD